MNEEVRDWLPDEAFTDDAVRAVLADVLAQWSAAWFSNHAPAISRIRIGESPGPAAGRRFEGVLATVGIPESGQRRLIEAALDIDLSDQVLLDGDRRVLDAFVAQVAEDLTARFDRAFGNGKSVGADAHLIAVLSLSGSDVLTVSMPRHALVAALKARFGRAQRSASAPRSRVKALGPTEVRVKGMLGCAELAVNDLEELAAGDVLILDRSLHEAVELRLAGSNRAIGRGRLGRSDGRVSIQF